MPKIGTRLMAVKVHTLPLDPGEPEVDPPPDLLAAVSSVVRGWTPARSPRFKLEESEGGFHDGDGEFETTDRIFTAYLKRPFTVAHAHELAQLLAHAVNSPHLIWVQLWEDAEGAGEIALFEVVHGKVQREKSP